jgi:hypothetical protein
MPEIQASRLAREQILREAGQANSPLEDTSPTKKKPDVAVSITPKDIAETRRRFEGGEKLSDIADNLDIPLAELRRLVFGQS